LAAEKAAGEYFEAVLKASPDGVRTVYAWVTGELFALMNAAGLGFESLKVQPQNLAALLSLIADGQINQTTAKTVLAEMFTTGANAAEIVAAKGLTQVSDADFIAQIIAEALTENPKELASYKAGKTTVANFLFGQVMRKAGGKANPQVVRAELEKQLQQN
jgi:aspartyl-tRNA(Asn)/glutamyl-tRNA(Gln) amidotransferase subunit B